MSGGDLSEAERRVLKGMLAGIMAGHSSIDSTTVCAHVPVAGAKGGLVDALLAACGVGSPVSLTVWLTDEDGYSPST